jgi:hypothetical protein
LDYLTKTGYLESISSKMPVRNGLPIPWITYPALNFLESNTSVNSPILEFGGGTSTFFWALRGNPVTYFELDRSWNTAIEKFFNELGRPISEDTVNLSAELSLEFSAELNKNFAQELSALRDDFSEDLNNYLVRQIRDAHLIMIDGHFRNYFLQLCSNASPHIIVVLDNADRGEYLPGIDFMIQAGWKKIDFAGLGPVNPYEWTTSIFSKSN